MNYSKLITRRKQYKYSANLCFDLENEERLDGFIPNVTTTEILAEYLYSIIEENMDIHSRILYGSYGTGKSHLLTVLCAILGHINTSGKGYKNFSKAIEKYDKDLSVFLNSFVKNSKPFLVVPVYSDFAEFDKCISFSLKKELNRNGISVCFKSYYDDAVLLLKSWEDGEESASRLSEVCGRFNVDKNELVTGLENYDNEYEKIFDDVFKAMTYGATFVSESCNLVDNLDAANDAIKDKYDGIVFVFDEFGRYIEDEGENIRVKSIQDIAEYCDHSNYNDYIILVSHKQLSLYTEKMNDELSDEWKKVEGRFKATSINIKYDQCLSLIPHIIPKTEKWNEFKIRYKKELGDLYAKAWDFKGFLVAPEDGNPFEGGYPLHPITLYALDRLSKKVAQNERTFFTYLASDEKNSLNEQLKKIEDDGDFHFVGLDGIYDYFETNIKSFRSSEVYDVYKKLQYALNKIGNGKYADIEAKILKVIAVINIIGDNSVLASDTATFVSVIDSSEDIICNALTDLENKKVIRFMRQYNYYEFLDSSIYDLDSMIAEKMETISDDMVVSVLNEEFSSFVIYPHDYNFTYHMNRIIIPVFVKDSDVGKKVLLRALPNYYDGVAVFVVDTNYKRKKYQEMYEIPDRAVLLINKKVSRLIDEVKRYIGIKYFYTLKDELKKDDPTVERELELYLEEQKGIVTEYVEDWKNIGADTDVFEDGKIQKINNEKDISFLASEMMYKYYPSTIIVNNDLVNKNVVSGAIKQARLKALQYIMNDDDIFKNCTKMSPEHTMMRSILSKNQIAQENDIQKYNELPRSGGSAGAPVMRVVNKYLNKCKKAQISLFELYDELKKPPYGLRDGYIPVILAYSLREYENVSLYFHGSERDYEIEDYMKAFESPEDYSIYICDWDDTTREYIKSLEEIYSAFLSGNGKNRLRELYVAMNTHFSSVSKSARTTEKFVSEKTMKYRDIMSVSYKDYNKFFFEILPTMSSDNEELIQLLKQIINELENVVSVQLNLLKKSVKKNFDVSDETDINSWLIDKYEKSWKEKEHRSFNYQINSFLDYLGSLNDNKAEDEVICDIAKLVSGFEIDYWNDSKIDDFVDELKSMISQLDEYEVDGELSENEIMISVKTGSGEERVTQFDEIELSMNSQMMYNKMKSTIDNFGQSISYEEKLAVLTKLLTDTMS